MDLGTTQQILLIILASALAIFLVAAIALMVMVIRLVKTLRIIADKAEHVVESAETAAQMLRRASGPLGLFRFVRNVADMVSQHKKTK